MDQPVTEDEHKEKVQDGDRKDRRGGGRQSKDRKTEYSVSVHMYRCRNDRWIII